MRQKDNQLTIRDYKTGRYEQAQYDLDHDPQYTVYGLVLLHVLATNPRIAERAGIRTEDAAEWVDEEMNALPTLAMERHEVRTGIVRPTTRTRKHALEFFEKLDGLEYHIERSEFPPSRDEWRCHHCPFFTPCQEDFTKGGSHYPVQQLLFYNYERLSVLEKVHTVQHRLKFG